MPVAESEVEFSTGIPDGMPLEFLQMGEQEEPEEEAPLLLLQQQVAVKPTKPIVGIIYPPPEVRSKFFK
jgi:hypothetical protein